MQQNPEIESILEQAQKLASQKNHEYNICIQMHKGH